MAPLPPLPVVINRSGGTAASLGDALEGKLREAFEPTGRSIDLHLVDGREIAETVKQLAGKDRIAVGGGDGTLGSAATILANGETALAILPLGTRNHLARQLSVPLDLTEAARHAVEGPITAIDLGCAGERVFVNNASLGIYTRLVRQRDKSRLPKLLATVPATVQVLRQLRSRALSLALDGETRDIRTPLLFIGNNRYELEVGKLGQRNCLDDGKLSVFAVAPLSAAGLMGFAVRTLIGRADLARDFAELCDAREVTVDGAGSAIDVALDGEVLSLELPVTFRNLPGALKLVAEPAEPSE